MHHVEYLFAFTAFKTGLMTNDQFVMVMTHWLKDKSQPVSFVVLQFGVLGEDEIALIDGLVARQLAKQGGNAQKCLSQLSTLGDIEAELIDLNDEELNHRIQSLRQSSEELGAKSTIRFRRISPHAKGALGEVFIAEDAELKRKVALKEIQDKAIGEKSAISRFVREAEVTGQLEHPGIVPVYGLGFYDDGRPFYAMKFIKGESLHEAIKQFHESYEARRPFDQQNDAFRKLIQRLIDVCNAMHYAHSKGVLHRDLKPDNIMIGKYGETLVVDWGLARVTGQVDSMLETEAEVMNSEEFQVETKAGSMMGTPQYMSPEQAKGELDKLNETSDVYSLGATLYVILTGKTPLGKVGSLKQFLKKVTKGEIRASKEANTNVPKALDAVCSKAMTLKQNDRYQSAEELGEDLERWLADQPVLAMRESLPMRVRRWTRQHATLTTSAVVFLVTSIVALGSGLFAVDSLRRTAVVAEKKAKNSEVQAVQNLELAKKNEKLAKQNLNLVEVERQKEEIARNIADDQRRLAERNAKEAMTNLELAQTERMKAERAAEEAIKAQKFAQRQEMLAKEAQKLAELQEMMAKKAQLETELAKRKVEAALKAEAAASKAAKLAQMRAEEEEKKTRCALKAEVKAKEIANAANEKLIRSLQISNSLRLVAQANAIREKNPVISTLLAREACLATDLVLPQASSSLRDSILTTPQKFSDLTGSAGLAITPDGKRLASGGRDKTIRIWDLTAKDPEATAVVLKGHTDAVTALAITADGKRLISGSYDDTLRIWDLTAENPETTAVVLKGYITGPLAIAPDGKRLVYARFDKAILLDLTEANPESTAVVLKGHSDEIRSLAITLDGQRLISGSADKTIRIWDLTAKDPEATAVVLKGHTNVVEALAITPDGKWLVSGSWDSTIRIWNLMAKDPETTAVELKGHTGSVNALAITPDGKRLVSAGGDGVIRIWDLTAKDPESTAVAIKGHTDGIGSLAITPDGKRLFSGSGDKTIRIWDLSAKNPETTAMILRGHTGPVYSFESTPDGDRLISGSADKTIRIWDLTAKDPQSTAVVLKGHTNSVKSLVTTSDGERLVSISSDNSIRTWDIDVDPLIDYARTLVGRELTEEERAFYNVPERVNKRPYKRTTKTYGFRLPFANE